MTEETYLDYRKKEDHPSWGVWQETVPIPDDPDDQGLYWLLRIKLSPAHRDEDPSGLKLPENFGGWRVWIPIWKTDVRDGKVAKYLILGRAMQFKHFARIPLGYPVKVTLGDDIDCGRI